jgi:hypothetical protein
MSEIIIVQVTIITNCSIDPKTTTHRNGWKYLPTMRRAPLQKNMMRRYIHYTAVFGSFTQLVKDFLRALPKANRENAVHQVAT